MTTNSYIELDDAQVVPLADQAPTLAEMDAAIASLMRFQRTLDKIPLLRNINLITLLQQVTPASIQRKTAHKKALQTVRYLARYNRACIAFWRAAGIQDMSFIEEDIEALRKLPIMNAEFFHTYSPQDRLSIGAAGNAQMLKSSGSTGRQKLFLMSKGQVAETLPSMKQFLWSNWEIDRYERVEIVVGVAKSVPGEPAWGAGYNMVQLLSMLSDEFPHLHFEHTGFSPSETAQHIQDVMRASTSKTLIALYTYAPNLISIVNELRQSQALDNMSAQIEFKFILTGEAFPPYKMFQVAEWLGIVDAGLIDRQLNDILADAQALHQLTTLLKTFSTGFGAAELKTGFSSNNTTMLWSTVMYLLERNQPALVRPFLEHHFGGQSFPWSALKSNPGVYFLIGSVDQEGKPSLRPNDGYHFGPAFATALTGEVVNCHLDVMHVWDLDELAGLLKAETGVDIKYVARALRIRYDSGDMILTNGRLDSYSNGGLDAAVSWVGAKIYGHHLQLVASQISELTGRFTAQSVDYIDGHRVLWLHFEANAGQNAEQIQVVAAKQLVTGLAEINQEFKTLREQILLDEGERGFREQVQVKILPYNHSRFSEQDDQFKNQYIYRPSRCETALDLDFDPILAGQ